VGFFDETKVGDVSSRLSADCQKVGDQVELNVNVALRSVIQAVLTLAFM
jgi:ABC-type multidrug transport system fused ATPase/permease subunit